MLNLELDGLKGPGDDDGESVEVAPEAESTEDEAGSDGTMALEAITQNDGAAFEEAIRRIMNKK